MPSLLQPALPQLSSLWSGLRNWAVEAGLYLERKMASPMKRGRFCSPIGRYCSAGAAACLLSCHLAADTHRGKPTEDLSAGQVTDARTWYNTHLLWGPPPAPLQHVLFFLLGSGQEVRGAERRLEFPWGSCLNSLSCSGLATSAACERDRSAGVWQLVPKSGPGQTKQLKKRLQSGCIK